MTWSSALQKLLAHMVITACLGLGMRSEDRTAAHAVAYAAHSAKYTSLMQLCGRDVELTVHVLCKLDNWVETLSVVLLHC